MNGIIKHLSICKESFFCKTTFTEWGSFVLFTSAWKNNIVENIKTKNSDQKKNNPQTGQILSACIAHRHAALWSDSRNPPPH